MINEKMLELILLEIYTGKNSEIDNGTKSFMKLRLEELRNEFLEPYVID